MIALKRPHEIPIPRHDSEVFVFRNAADGLLYYKTSTNETALAQSRGDVFFIKGKYSVAGNYTDEILDTNTVDDGLLVRLRSVSEVRQVIVGGGGGGNGTSGYSGYSGASSAGTAWQLNGNTNGAEKSIGTNDNFDFPVLINGAEVGKFTSAGITIKDGGIIKVASGAVKTTYDDTSKTYDAFVDEGAGVTDDDFMGLGFNLKSSVYRGNRNALGILSNARLAFAQGFYVNFFVVTDDHFVTQGIPLYANDAAAGVAGLTTGMLFRQSDGASGFYLKVKS